MGMAVYGPNMGALLKSRPAQCGRAPAGGKLTVTGAVDEEELGSGGDRKLTQEHGQGVGGECADSPEEICRP